MDVSSLSSIASAIDGSDNESRSSPRSSRLISAVSSAPGAGLFGSEMIGNSPVASKVSNCCSIVGDSTVPPPVAISAVSSVDESSRIGVSAVSSLSAAAISGSGISRVADASSSGSSKLKSMSLPTSAMRIWPVSSLTMSSAAGNSPLSAPRSMTSLASPAESSSAKSISSAPVSSAPASNERSTALVAAPALTPENNS